MYIALFALSKTKQDFDCERKFRGIADRGLLDAELTSIKPVGTVPGALLVFFRHQSKQAKSLRSVEGMTHRRLPDNFNPLRWRTLTAKQIDSKPVADCRGAVP